MNEDPSGRNPHQRMTLTFAGIARARLVLVTVTGEEKREALARVVAGDPDCPGTHVTATASCGSPTPPPPGRHTEKARTPAVLGSAKGGSDAAAGCLRRAVRSGCVGVAVGRPVNLRQWRRS